MRRIDFACSLSLLLSLAAGGVTHCAGSDQQRLVRRDGKTLICTAHFPGWEYEDCGTDSYDLVFTARIMAVERAPSSGDEDWAEGLKGLDATPGGNLRLTVEPEEVFNGHPDHTLPIFAEQGECFPVIRVGDEWLIFAQRRAKTNEFEISYRASNPSGPIGQRTEYVQRLRRLARGDGLSYVAGEVDYPTYDSSLIYHSNPQPNHRLDIKNETGKQIYSVVTNAEGRFELGPVAPGAFHIDANTDSQFHDEWSDVWGRMVTRANGCAFVRIELEINSEISGRIILPEGYQYKKSEIGNFFPLFYVDVDTVGGKQVRGSSIEDGLKFTVRGLAPGSYIVQLVNYAGKDWIKVPVYAPGVTETSAALRIDLGQAEHRTGIEIRVPPEALKAAQ